MRIRLVTLVVALAAAALVATAAFAHVNVKSRSPGKGATASNSIGSASVTFKGPIRSGSLRVVGPGGRVVSSGSGRDPRNITRVRASLKSSLSSGRYKATYRIVAADGHRQKGSWRFRLR